MMDVVGDGDGSNDGDFSCSNGNSDDGGIVGR